MPAYLRREPAQNPDPQKNQRLPLALQEYGVPFDAKFESFSVTRAINFAMTHLARGDTLDDAKKALSSDPVVIREVGGDVVEYIYRGQAGIQPDKGSAAPPAEAVMKARRWLEFSPMT
jgi:hypothetical protein